MTKNDIMFRLATLCDIREISELMNEAYERLENKSIYVCDDTEHIKNCLSDKGFGVVAYTESGKIVGSFLMYYPGDSEDNLGRDIGLTEDELRKTVHMESAVVHPDYRGRGLQYRMLVYAEEMIDKSKYRYFLSTVSPENPASFRSLERNGYRHILTKEKYNGLIRRIYMKEAE